MSADNGIYIAKFPDGWRWCHGSAIENLTYYPAGSPERKNELKAYFGDSKLYTDEQECVMDAFEFAKTVSILEYGVSDLGEFEAFE